MEANDQTRPEPVALAMHRRSNVRHVPLAGLGAWEAGYRQACAAEPMELMRYFPFGGITRIGPIGGGLGGGVGGARGTEDTGTSTGPESGETTSTRNGRPVDCDWDDDIMDSDQDEEEKEILTYFDGLASRLNPEVNESPSPWTRHPLFVGEA